MRGHNGPYPEDEDPFGYGGGMDDLDVPDQDGPAVSFPRAVQTAGVSVQAPAAPSAPAAEVDVRAPGPASGTWPGASDRPWGDSDEENPFGFSVGLDDM